MRAKLVTDIPYSVNFRLTFRLPASEQRFVGHVIRGRVARYTIQLSIDAFHPGITLEAYKLKRAWHATLFEVTVPTASEGMLAHNGDHAYMAGWVCSATDYGWRLKLLKRRKTSEGYVMEIPSTGKHYSPVRYPQNAEVNQNYARLLQRGVRELRSLFTPPQPVASAFARTPFRF